MNKRFCLFLPLFVFSLWLSGCGFFAPATYDATQYNAIHQAALDGDTAKLKELLHDSPQLVNKADYDKNTLLHLATLHDRLDAVNYLLSDGANVNAQNAKDMTPLHFAAQQGFADVAKSLLSYKPDLSVKDSRGWTALVWAEKSHHTNIVILLTGNEGHP